MAVALLTTSTHALLLCMLLVQTLQLSTSKSAAPDCGVPKTVMNAKVNIEEPFSETNMRYIRYTCQEGYKRKAGTSNLAICVFDNASNRAYWKYGNISCIRDPSIPMTTHSTSTSPTTTGPSSSRDFTSSYAELESFTKTSLSTATVSVHQTRPTSKTRISRLTQVPLCTTKTTTGCHHTTDRQTTHSTGSQSTTSLPTTVRKATTRTTTHPKSSEHVTTSRTTQSVPESTYPSTEETLTLSTITYYATTAHDSNVSDTSLWHLERTAGSVAGALSFLIIIVIIWLKRRNQHSQVPQEEPHPEGNYSDDQEEPQEESSNL